MENSGLQCKTSYRLQVRAVACLPLAESYRTNSTRIHVEITWYFLLTSINRLYIDDFLTCRGGSGLFECSPCDNEAPPSAWTAPPMGIVVPPSLCEIQGRRHEGWGIFPIHSWQAKEGCLFPQAHSLQWICGSNNSIPYSAILTQQQSVTFRQRYVM